MSEQQPIQDYQPLSEPNRFLAIVSVLASPRDCLAWLWLHARGQNLNGCLPVMQKGKPEWWEDAIEFLKEDELLGEVVRKYPNGSLEGKGELFETTIRSIVGQQISVVASDAIWGRLLTMIGKPNPENVQLRRSRVPNPRNLPFLIRHAPTLGHVQFLIRHAPNPGNVRISNQACPKSCKCPIPN